MDRRLKVRMVEKGVKVFDLARYLGVDPSRASRIVNCWIIPDDATKKKIARFLGVSVDSLWKVQDQHNGTGKTAVAG